MTQDTQPRPKNPQLEEFIDFLHPPILLVPELEVGTLYGGIGGRLGRVGVYLGIDQVNQSPSYRGYRRTAQGLFLTQETDLRKDALGNPTHQLTYTRGTFFQPHTKLANVPADLSEQKLLAWLVNQDLAHVQLLAKRLETAGERFTQLNLYQDEINRTKDIMAVVEENLSLIESPR